MFVLGDEGHVRVDVHQYMDFEPQRMQPTRLCERMFPALIWCLKHLEGSIEVTNLGFGWLVKGSLTLACVLRKMHKEECSFGFEWGDELVNQ